MIPDIYLKPPTIAEFQYVGLTRNVKPQKSYDLITRIIPSFPEMMQPLILPEELTLTSFKLEAILDNINYTEEFHPDINTDDQQFYKDIFAYYSPTTTWQNKGGECKSLAIFAVAFLRQKRIPSRFRMYNRNHILFEQLVQNKWISREPQDLDKDISPLLDVSIDFSRYYELLLRDMHKNEN